MARNDISGMFGRRGPTVEEPQDNRRVSGLGHIRAKLRQDRAMGSKYVGNDAGKTHMAGNAKGGKAPAKGGGKKGCNY